MCRDSFHGQSPLFFLQSCYKELVLTPAKAETVGSGCLINCPGLESNLARGIEITTYEKCMI